MSSESTTKISPKVRLALDAARDLFVEGGFDEVSMDAIAAKAGVSKATLYAHFANKEALFLAMLARQAFEFSRRFDIPERFAGGDPGVVLLRFARSFSEAFRKGDGVDLMRMFMAEMHRFPGAARAFHDNGPVQTRGQVAALLESINAAGALSIDDCELAADQLTSLIMGHVPVDHALGLPSPSTAESERRVRAAVRLFVRGYAPDAREKAR